MSTIAPTSSSKSSSLQPLRRPDGLARPADLGGVREVEDRQPVPRLGDLALAARPHRRDVLLEGVEVAERRRPQDRRPEGEIRLVQARPRHRRPARRRRAAKPSTSSPSASIRRPRASTLVEGRERLPEEDRVVRPPRIGGDEPPPDDLEVQPRALASAPPPPAARAPRGAVALANMADPHARSLGGPRPGPSRRDQNGRNIISHRIDDEADPADQEQLLGPARCRGPASSASPRRDRVGLRLLQSRVRWPSATRMPLK